MNTTVYNNSNKIQDFGQKIGGARKDYFAELKEFGESLCKVDIETLKNNPLSEVVRLPNLQKMAKNSQITSVQARAIWTVWRTLGAKPKRPYALKLWASEAVQKIADIRAILDGGRISEKILASVEFQVMEAAGWPEKDFSFSHYKVEYYKRGCRITDYKSCYAIVSANFVYKTCEKLEDVPAMMADLIASDSESKSTCPKLEIKLSRMGLYYVVPAAHPELVLNTYKSLKEAREEVQNNKAFFAKRYKDVCTVPAIRRSVNRPRVGQDWRAGQDASPEFFAAALPFRGVEFGNWLKQSERANLLNAAYDGFHDLAAVLNLTAEDITLNGSLAFAFASRGHSNALAHYECGRRVINLTKLKGAGCMAHEWFHAVDHFARNGSRGFITECPDLSRAGLAAARLMDEIKKSAYYTRSKKMAAFAGLYWIEPYELAARGFEAAMLVILDGSGICSDFLVNLVNIDNYTESDPTHRNDIYPYPTLTEATALVPYYVDFFKAVFGAHARVCPEVMAIVQDKAEDVEKERAEFQRIIEEKKAEERAYQEKLMAEQKQEALERNRKKRAELEEQAKKEKAHHEEVKAASEKIAAYYRALPGIEAAKAFVYTSSAWGDSVAIIAAAGDKLVCCRTNGKELEEKDVKTIAAKFFVFDYKQNKAIRKHIRSPRSGMLSFNSANAAAFLDALEFMAPYDTIRTFENYKYGAKVMPLDELCALIAPAGEIKPDNKRKEPKAAASKSTGKKAAQNGSKQEIDLSIAPDSRLSLVEIPDGVAVTGEPYVTFKNRKIIKAHGLTWNKDAGQWQITGDPDKVAHVRDWFSRSKIAACK